MELPYNFLPQLIYLLRLKTVIFGDKWMLKLRFWLGVFEVGRQVSVSVVWEGEILKTFLGNLNGSKDQLFK
jgi:hypothetical protein